MPGAPAVIASASVIIGQKTGWFGAAKFRYLGPRPLIEDDSVRSGPMRVVNANVGYRFEKPSPVPSGSMVLTTLSTSAGKRKSLG